MSYLVKDTREVLELRLHSSLPRLFQLPHAVSYFYFIIYGRYSVIKASQRHLIMRRFKQMKEMAKNKASWRAFFIGFLRRSEGHSLLPILTGLFIPADITLLVHLRTSLFPGLSPSK